MWNFLTSIVANPEAEKQKDYRNVVILQVVIIVVGLVFSSLVDFSKNDFLAKSAITLFSFFGAVYAFLLWDLLKNFTRKKWLVGLVFFVLLIITVVGTLGEFPFYRFIDIPDRRTYLFGIHGLLFPIEITIIGFAIRDLFSGRVFTVSKLWGAACVYLMIGITFGSLYDLINIVHPAAFGVDVGLGIPSYTECIYYSFNILGGLDTAYPNPIPLVRNIGVIEAVWSNLYAILIIGKLLGLPGAITKS